MEHEAESERVCFVRTLGIDRKRWQDIQAQAFERLADEGLRITAHHLRDLTGPRCHAVLCATAIKLESALTDAALSMFDKLMGSIARRAARQSDERTLQSARGTSTHPVADQGLQSRDCGSDPFVAVDRDVGWQEFLHAVLPSRCARSDALSGRCYGRELLRYAIFFLSAEV